MSGLLLVGVIGGATRGAEEGFEEAAWRSTSASCGVLHLSGCKNAEVTSNLVVGS